MGKPAPLAADVLTPEQQQRILDGLREGKSNATVAALFGLTGTKLRGIRHRDEEFGLRCREAEAEAQGDYPEVLRETVRERALGGSDRLLEVELAAWGGSRYEHLKRNRLTVDGQIRHTHVIVLDPDALEAAPLEKLVALRNLLREIGGGEMLIEGEPPLLELGRGEAA